MTACCDDSSEPGYKWSTLVDLLGKRAQNQSDVTAYTFLQDGETASSRLTYKELDLKARAIAAFLQSLGTTGERALLLYPPGLEFVAAFCGCLYASVIAIPAPPPDLARLKRTLPRLRAIAKDAQASLVLTTSRILSQLEGSCSQMSEFQAMRWLASEEVSSELAEQWQEPVISRNTLAYLQYTSGSTSTPKGVMVSHGNLMHHSAYISQAWGYTPDSIAATWMPYFHDYGLIDGLIQPLYAGIPCYVMSPLAFVKQPLRWLQTISRYKVTHSQGPNFAYDYCLHKIAPEQLTTLDLSSWRTASNGAEPIRKDTVERFIETFEPCGFRRESFYPAYGLAEATLLVSTKRHTDVPVICTVQASALEKNRIVEVDAHQKGVRRVVSCGPPICGIKVVIANPETLIQCASDEVGEIWVSDLSVAHGYWNRPEETDSTFRAYLADTGSGPFLRTGDLGFMKDGELFVTGRLKDLTIIRGGNHYPQDIERTVEQSHPVLRSGCGAAFSVEVDGEERLVIVQEVERSYLRDLDVDEVVGAIRKAVSEQHELQVYAVLLLKTGSIPKTSSGKIQRHTCRSRFIAESLPVVGASILDLTDDLDDSIEGNNSRTQETSSAKAQTQRQLSLELELRDSFARLLGIAPSQLNPQQPLITLGLDSLQAVEIKNYIEAKFGLVLPMETFLEDISITQLATRILGQGDKGDGRGENYSYPSPHPLVPPSPHPSLRSLKKQPVPDSTAQPQTAAKNGMQFSLFYFSSNEAEFTDDKYRLLIEGAKFADRNGFVAVWIPERHFHAFGGIYPNPSVLGSALAMVTERVRLRAGSVVMPLHKPIRVAEEWSVVDNLSRGRVDIAFARGWNPNDFVLSPQTYANRTEVMFSGIQTVQKLWRGESISLPNGVEQETEIKIYPLPKQRELPIWITCSGGKERFIEAGAFGANILTALLFQPIEELAEKISSYRDSRAKNGHDPEAGHVTLMLHTFVGEEMDVVRNSVRGPFTEYLKTSVDLWRHGIKSLDDLTEKEREDLLAYAFERYFQTSALFGTPDTCLKLVARLKEIGVDEIACLIDFGVDVDSVMAALYSLEKLKDDFNLGVNPNGRKDEHQHSQTNITDKIAQENADQLLEKLDQLSDQEVNSLLSELLAVEEISK